MSPIFLFEGSTLVPEIASHIIGVGSITVYYVRYKLRLRYSEKKIHKGFLKLFFGHIYSFVNKGNNTASAE